MDKKFLTVFAVYDDETQKVLGELQKKILDLGFKGTQTMDIPFHISLGSFPVEDRQMLEKRIVEVSKTQQSFDISLEKINHFGNKVLFVEPIPNDELMSLQSKFDNNYAGGHKFHAHSTLSIDEEKNVEIAKVVAEQNFKPFKAKIVGLQMGEFFPTNMIIEKEFTK